MAKLSAALIAVARASSPPEEPWTGAQTADSYLERLRAFQHDPSVPAATYTNGVTASFDPSSDGGGLGDVIGIVTREAQAAFTAGCRYHSPHVARGQLWRYAAVAARASLCTAADGWNCVFADGFAPLPTEDPAWSHVRADERMEVGPADVGATAQADRTNGVGQRRRTA